MSQTNLDYENISDNVVCFENGAEVGGGLKELSCVGVIL